MLWLTGVPQAEQLCLGSRNCADLDKLCRSACIWGERRVSVVFEVKPVVAILLAEDVGFDIVVSGIFDKSDFCRVEPEADQSALYREQTADNNSSV